MLDRFLSVLSVVSRIPVKLKFTFDPSRMDFYLPVTGLFPALTGILLFTAGSFLFDFSAAAVPSGMSALTAAVILIVQYFCYNLFHLDGLMDTADAFFGAADREKRLAILKDPRVGVYGFFAGAAVLGLKGILLYALLPFAAHFPTLVFAWPLWGRFAVALVPCMSKPFNKNGLGALAEHSRPRRCFTGLILSLLLWIPAVFGIFYAASLTGMVPPPVLLFSIPAAAILILCLLLCLLIAYYYARLYKKNLGGYTGDTLGATIETAELLCMAVTLIVLIGLR